MRHHSPEAQAAPHPPQWLVSVMMSTQPSVTTVEQNV